MRTKSAARLARVGVLVAAVGVIGIVPEARAQTQPSTGQSNERVLRTLGGSTRFSPPVRTVAALRKMADANRRDLEKVLSDGGRPYEFKIQQMPMECVSMAYTFADATKKAAH